MTLTTKAPVHVKFSHGPMKIMNQILFRLVILQAEYCYIHVMVWNCFCYSYVTVVTKQGYAIIATTLLWLCYCYGHTNKGITILSIVLIGVRIHYSFHFF